MIFIAAKQELILSCRHSRTFNVTQSEKGKKKPACVIHWRIQNCQIALGKSLWNTVRGIKHIWTCCYRTLINPNATSCWDSWHHRTVDYFPASLVMFYSLLLIQFCHHLFGVFHSSLISNINSYFYMSFSLHFTIFPLCPPPPHMPYPGALFPLTIVLH